MGLTIVNLKCINLPLTQLFTAHCPIIKCSIGQRQMTTLVRKQSTARRMSSRLLESILLPQLPRRNRTKLFYASSTRRLHKYGCCVITIPAPISLRRDPSLAPLCSTDRAMKGILNENSVIVCRSAIYPNVARSRYIPVLREASKLIFGHSFFTKCSPRHVGPKSGRRAIRGVVGMASNSAPKTTRGISTLCQSIVRTKAFPMSDVGITRTTGIVRGSRHSVGVTFVGRLSGVFRLVNVSAGRILTTTKAG